MKLLHGLSTHKYSRSAALAGEVFGVSASNLSKRFKQQTTKTLKQFYNRSLSAYDIVGVFIDGKRYAEDGLMVALGVTIDGQKVFLGIEQSHSENAKSIEQWLDRLVERGLKFEQGILFIIDGSKGIKKPFNGGLVSMLLFNVANGINARTSPPIWMILKKHCASVA